MERMENTVLFEEAERFAGDLLRAWGDDVRGVALFGSRVRGAHRPESDLDVLVVADRFPASRPDRFRAIRPHLEGRPALLRYGTFLLLPTTTAGVIQPFTLGLLDGCRILFERDRFLTNLLDRTRRRLEELGSRKARDSQGNEYWILIPDEKWRPGMEVVV